MCCVIGNVNLAPPIVLDSHDGNAQKNFPISLRIFSNRTNRQDIYALRYRAYAEADLIDKQDVPEFSDRFDDLPTSYTIGAYNKGVCIGSLRLAFGISNAHTPTMPCQTVFGDIEGLGSPRPGKLVEFTRMVVAPEITNASFRATLYGTLVRTAAILSKAGNADFALIAVDPKMMRFYSAMCGFKFIAGPRPYPGVTFQTNLMGRDFSKLEERRTLRNAFFSFSEADVAAARSVFGPADEALVAAE
jgi:N-acyl-L-homoserine lactone synthetase